MSIKVYLQEPVVNVISLSFLTHSLKEEALLLIFLFFNFIFCGGALSIETAFL